MCIEIPISNSNSISHPFSYAQIDLSHSLNTHNVPHKNVRKFVQLNLFLEKKLHAKIPVGRFSKKRGLLVRVAWIEPVFFRHSCLEKASQVYEIPAGRTKKTKPGV